MVGFYDSRNLATQGLLEYPLMALWEQGLPLTICTDNLGISRTTLSEEFITRVFTVGSILKICIGFLGFFTSFAFKHLFITLTSPH